MRKKKEITTVIYVPRNEPRSFWKCGDLLIVGSKPTHVVVKCSGRLKITTIAYHNEPRR